MIELVENRAGRCAILRPSAAAAVQANSNDPARPEPKPVLLCRTSNIGPLVIMTRCREPTQQCLLNNSLPQRSLCGCSPHCLREERQNFAQALASRSPVYLRAVAGLLLRQGKLADIYEICMIEVKRLSARIAFFVRRHLLPRQLVEVVAVETSVVKSLRHNSRVI